MTTLEQAFDDIEMVSYVTNDGQERVASMEDAISRCPYLGSIAMQESPEAAERAVRMHERGEAAKAAQLAQPKAEIVIEPLSLKRTVQPEPLPKPNVIKSIDPPVEVIQSAADARPETPLDAATAIAPTNLELALQHLQTIQTEAISTAPSDQALAPKASLDAEQPSIVKPRTEIVANLTPEPVKVLETTTVVAAAESQPRDFAVTAEPLTEPLISEAILDVITPLPAVMLYERAIPEITLPAIVLPEVSEIPIIPLVESSLALPEQPPRNSFETFAAEYIAEPAEVSQAVQDTMPIVAAEQPLEVTLALLVQPVEQPITLPDNTPVAEIVTLAQEVSAAISETPAALNDETTQQIYRLLTKIGYEQPADVLQIFITQYGIQFLAQGIQALAELRAEEYRQEIAPAFLAQGFTFGSSTDAIHGGLGRLLLTLFSQPSSSLVA